MVVYAVGHHHFYVGTSYPHPVEGSDHPGSVAGPRAVCRWETLLRSALAIGVSEKMGQFFGSAKSFAL